MPQQPGYRAFFQSDARYGHNPRIPDAERFRMKLSALASQLGLKMKGDDVEIIGPAPIEAAGPGLITFAVDAKYAGALRACNASAAIVPRELASDAQCATLISSNPMFDFARALEIFFPPYRPPHGIHPSAAVSPDAKIGEGASIGEF